MCVRAATLVCGLAALARAVGAQPPQPDAGTLGMLGLDGPYPMSREGSGTSWQPDSTPMSGVHAMHGAWMTMVHAQADLVYDDQGGPRGALGVDVDPLMIARAVGELVDACLVERRP